MMMSDFEKDIAKDYTRYCFPNEMCGAVVDGKFLAMDNIAKNPKLDFEMENAEIFPHLKSGKLQAIIHSHCISDLSIQSCPSMQDMIGQLSSGVDWGIIDTNGSICRDPYWWGEFKLEQPLIGKKFHSGIDDCYSIIRKYYKQKRGVILPEFPRDDAWWSKGGDLYTEGFKKAGFTIISKEDLQDGDVILGKVKSDVINHGGVIINNREDGYGLILHHLPNRLSRREPANAWINRAELFLRHKDVT